MSEPSSTLTALPPPEPVYELKRMGMLPSPETPGASSSDAATVAALATLNAALADAAEVDLSWINQERAEDPWALAPDALRFITKLVTCLRPQHILEFGSGLSTRVLARAASMQEGACYISSIDHDPEFGKLAATEYFLRPDERCVVSMQIAPLVLRACAGKMLPVYHIDRSSLATQLAVDLVLVDGPPMLLGGREGTLYQALEFAKPGTIVLLDDAGRPTEMDTLRRWQESLGRAVEVIRLAGFTRGMAAIIIRDPIPLEGLWRHRLALTNTELSERIRPDDVVLAVDGGWWLSEVSLECRVIPFPEHDGEYWGAPATDHDAIAELERLQSSGARFLALGWTSFWWIESYPEFHAYLQERHTCVLENDRVVLFALSASESGFP